MRDYRNLLNILIEATRIMYDAIWDEAKEFLITVEDSLGDKLTIVRMKGLTDSTYFYLRVEWEDTSRSVRPDAWHYPWSNHTSGGQDFFYALFDNGSNDTIGANCANMCHGGGTVMVNPGPAMLDAWIWKSGQTNPTGTLDDLHFEPNDSGMSYDVAVLDPPVWEQNKDVHDDPVYQPKDTIDFSGDFLFRSNADSMKIWIWPTNFVLPGYVVADELQEAAGESRWEIEAKGKHSDLSDRWVVEFKRKLNTGNEDDIPFVLGEKINCTIGVTDSPNYNSPDPHLGSEPFIIQF